MRTKKTLNGVTEDRTPGRLMSAVWRACEVDTHLRAQPGAAHELVATLIKNFVQMVCTTMFFSGSALSTIPAEPLEIS